MVLFVRMVLPCLVLFLPSTTVSVWKGPRLGCDGWVILGGLYGACLLTYVSKRHFQFLSALVPLKIPLSLPLGHWFCYVPVLTCFVWSVFIVYFGLFNDYDIRNIRSYCLSLEGSYRMPSQFGRRDSHLLDYPYISLVVTSLGLIACNYSFVSYFNWSTEVWFLCK